MPGVPFLARIAAEISGAELEPLTPEQIAANEERQAEYAFIRNVERWEAQERRRAEQERQAQEEARKEHERRMARQRETADRMRAAQVARDSQEASYRAARTEALLVQQERQRLQRDALAQQRAQFLALGPMGHEPPKPDPVLDKLIEIEDKIEQPEPTLYERLTDPRRFKFSWQP